MASGREQYLQALAGLREMTRTQADRVAGLLAKQGEATLTVQEQAELLALMQVYQQLWVRQSEALAEAVRRRLHAPLTP